MEVLTNVFENLINLYESPVLYTYVIMSVLFAVLILSVYIFVVYRFVSHRAFYNKSFNISLAVIPFFISTIILCLQSNIVITLGTIGALAIIRFRTAIKDPVDMVYILWAIHIGITCGCQLYEVAVLTSLVVTIVLFVLENLGMGRKPLVMIIHCDEAQEESVLDVIEEQTKKYRVKSRNYSAKGLDLVIEASTKNQSAISAGLKELSVEKFSIIEYDCDDVI